MKGTLVWKGDAVKRAVAEAQRRAIDATTEVAADRARTSHPMWEDRSGATSASIKSQPAKRTGRGWRGAVISTAAHFLFLEIGHHGRKGDRTLRRAADAEATRLPERTRAALPADYRR